MDSMRWTDERLLTELRAALATPQVPAGVLEAAKAVYTWRTIDAELAALAYDSEVAAEDVLAGARGEAATLRTLTFENRDLVIEVGITSDALLGQLVPAQSGRVEVIGMVGVRAFSGNGSDIDEAGCFSVHPVPSGRFRLEFTLAGGKRTVTDWVTL